MGVFDGVHRGHQRVIGTVRRLATESSTRAAVVTFDPHPARVLAPTRAPLSIGTIGQRTQALDRLGIDVVRIITFTTEMSHESALEFIERVVVGEFHARHVVVGRDFRFGHGREGDVALLEREGERLGFDVTATPIYGAATRWSSTVVRESLQSGQLELANEVLGRPFTLRGVVEHGDARGGDLGFPTANLAVAQYQQLPDVGVYAGGVRLGSGEWWPAAISVGTRPQFYDDGGVLVEVHVPGFSGNLYDLELDIVFLEHLRGQRKFDSVTDLITQMGFDVNETLEIFNKFSPQSYPLLG